MSATRRKWFEHRFTRIAADLMKAVAHFAEPTEGGRQLTRYTPPPPACVAHVPERSMDLPDSAPRALASDLDEL
jgi:hypothetical protein